MSLEAVLKLPCYVVAVILGRPTAFAVAYVDHIPVELAGPVAVVVMYAYASFLMSHGCNLLAKAESSRWTVTRQLATFAHIKGAELPPGAKVPIITVLAVVPVVGLWLAVGFAAACLGSSRTRQHWYAALVATVSGISLTIAMVASRHVTVPLPVPRVWLEVTGYLVIPAVAVWRLRRNPLDVRKVGQIIHDLRRTTRTQLRYALAATTGLLHG